MPLVAVGDKGDDGRTGEEPRVEDLGDGLLDIVVVMYTMSEDRQSICDNLCDPKKMEFGGEQRKFAGWLFVSIEWGCPQILAVKSDIKYQAIENLDNVSYHHTRDLLSEKSTRFQEHDETNKDTKKDVRLWGLQGLTRCR